SVGADDVVNLDRPADDGLPGLDVTEAPKPRIQLRDEAIDIRRIDAALLLPALDVETDISVVVHRQGEESGGAPVVHPPGPERHQRLVPGDRDAAGHLAHERPRKRLLDPVAESLL